LQGERRTTFPEGGGLVAKDNERDEREVLGFLGIGLDNKDGHKRITQSESFLLVGGSEETHEHMQDTAVRFEEALRKRGKRLRQTSPQEAADLLREAMES
jgi:hypothetical protein